jgi:WxL Interacting Protein, peptidoglycan binding domain/LysM domain
MKKKYILVGIMLAIIFAFVNISHASKFGMKIDEASQIRNFEFSYNGQNKIEGSVLLVNMEKDKTVKVVLSGVDGKTNSKGNIYYKESKEEQTKIGKWLIPETPLVVLEPNETKKVQFEILVPEKITPGIYAGGISAGELIGEEEDLTQNFSAKVRTRVIKEILLKIKGESITKFDFNSYEFTNIRGKKELNFQIVNQGNTLIAATGEIQIKGNDGELIDSFPINAKGLLQDEIFKGNYQWTNAPQWGDYTAEIQLKVSEYNPFEETFAQVDQVSETLEIKLSDYPSLLPYLYGLIGLILIFLFFFIKKKLYISKCVEYIATEEDTIQSISDKNGMNWKKLVKINNIKPPYDIHPDMKLLIRPKKDANTAQE